MIGIYHKAKFIIPVTFGFCLVFAEAQAVDPSKGVYRIPYANGTEVKVTNDHLTHNPIGRIDMRGVGDGPHKVVAAADGTIRFIEDGFSAQQDSSTASSCNNNYVWIEHANGEWTKYSHMKKSTTTGAANLKVGDTVKAGTYLGNEGAVGCASGPHLHLEIGVPASDPITTVGGFLKDNSGSKRNRNPRICSIPGGFFKAGQTYEARSVPGNLNPGSKEVARHGLPIREYQCLFDQAVSANYAPVWLDMFDVHGKTYVNVIFRPAGNTPFQAFHGLNGVQYQQQFDAWTNKGYRPAIVESYNDNGLRYAVVFRKEGGPAYSAYHGLSAAQHQAKLDSLTAQGYRPKMISVVSTGGRKYAGLYEKTNVGGWQVKSQLSPAEYQTLYNSNAQAGRHVAYLNAYSHAGEPFIVAIWTSETPAGGKQRHGLTSAAYQEEWSSAIDANLLTRAVTGYAAGNGARYAATWRK
ncbi:MAG: peptidoglycan DD-metalloendopeptidase family protein [Nitrospira sp.]|nr:peptidoglycan DD-metalloendopeptidase family protein [Nitrospira sp.]